MENITWGFNMSKEFVLNLIIFSYSFKYSLGVEPIKLSLP